MERGAISVGLRFLFYVGCFLPPMLGGLQVILCLKIFLSMKVMKFCSLKTTSSIGKGMKMSIRIQIIMMVFGCKP